jgi:hypothetical protein
MPIGLRQVAHLSCRNRSPMFSVKHEPTKRRRSSCLMRVARPGTRITVRNVSSWSAPTIIPRDWTRLLEQLGRARRGKPPWKAACEPRAQHRRHRLQTISCKSATVPQKRDQRDFVEAACSRERYVCVEVGWTWLTGMNTGRRCSLLRGRAFAAQPQPQTSK